MAPRYPTKKASGTKNKYVNKYARVSSNKTHAAYSVKRGILKQTIRRLETDAREDREVVLELIRNVLNLEATVEALYKGEPSSVNSGIADFRRQSKLVDYLIEENKNSD